MVCHSLLADVTSFTFLSGPQSLPYCKELISSVCNQECVFAVSNELNAIFRNDVGRVCLIFGMLLRLFHPAVSKSKEETAEGTEASPGRRGSVPASGLTSPSSFLIPTSIF